MCVFKAFAPSKLCFIKRRDTRPHRVLMDGDHVGDRFLVAADKLPFIAAHAPHQTTPPAPHDSHAPHPPPALPRRSIRFCVRVTIWRVGGW